MVTWDGWPILLCMHMQCRLPATIRCLSHPSAHVRALSTSVLRDILHNGSIRSSTNPPRKNGIHNQYFNLDVIDWQADIEKCLTWEALSRISNGLSIEFLDIVAKELGCTISIWHERKPCGAILENDLFCMKTCRNMHYLYLGTLMVCK